VLQEAKAGTDAEADEAVKTAATERDNLKAQVASLTKKVSEVETQLQQALFLCYASVHACNNLCISSTILL